MWFSVFDFLFIKQVYQESIVARHAIWMGPRSNLLIQALDDSDDPTTQTLIKEEVLKWQQNGAHRESQVGDELQLHQGL